MGGLGGRKGRGLLRTREKGLLWLADGNQEEGVKTEETHNKTEWGVERGEGSGHASPLDHSKNGWKVTAAQRRTFQSLSSSNAMGCFGGHRSPHSVSSSSLTCDKLDALSLGFAITIILIMHCLVRFGPSL